MKKIIILPFLFLAILGWGQAQFVLQNGLSTKVYSNINTAIDSAVNGDTLYLPGGGFAISPTTINKILHWVGQGHYPDSTKATMPTRITSALVFSGSCDNSSFEGIYFTTTLSFGSSTDDVFNIKMKRCRVDGTMTLRSSSLGNPLLNFQISECVLKDLNANNGSNCLIEKSLISGVTQYFFQSNFIHNNFNTNSTNLIYYCQSCQYIDNVFAGSYGFYYSNSNVLTNNLFVSVLPNYGTNSGNNNIYNIGSSNIYTDITHSINVTTFSYDNNYHLKISATGTAESDGSTVGITGKASDNTNAGIYGTTTPYKTIPYYPHIKTATIANEAVNDQLGVTINAEAQSR